MFLSLFDEGIHFAFVRCVVVLGVFRQFVDELSGCSCGVVDPWVVGHPVSVFCLDPVALGLVVVFYDESVYWWCVFFHDVVRQGLSDQFWCDFESVESLGLVLDDVVRHSFEVEEAVSPAL